MSLQHVENYIKEIYVARGQRRCLEAQYFRIVTTDQIIGNIMLSIREKRKREKHKKYCESEGALTKQRESKAKYKKTQSGAKKMRKSVMPSRTILKQILVNLKTTLRTVPFIFALYVIIHYIADHLNFSLY